MSTKENANDVSLMVPGKDATLDDYITGVVLDQTVGQLMKMRELAQSARAYFIANLVFEAIFSLDIGNIAQIISRVDGSVPSSKDRGDYANIFGNALEDVMNYDDKNDLEIFPDDPCIIALAKVTYLISMKPAGKNPTAKREKQQAIDMILTRTGGRKSEPAKELVERRFVEPDWLLGLPATQGGQDGADVHSDPGTGRSEDRADQEAR